MHTSAAAVPDLERAPKVATAMDHTVRSQFTCRKQEASCLWVGILGTGEVYGSPGPMTRTWIRRNGDVKATLAR